MSAVTFTGGLRIGASYWIAANYSWSLARLIIDSESLRLETMFEKHVFLREKIKKISPYKGYFSTGYQIDHTLGQVSPFVVFWTVRNFEKVASALKANGYLQDEEKL
jgi:hypothetical protein